MFDVTLSEAFLKQFFSLRKQYLTTLIYYITALLRCQTTNIKKLSVVAKTRTHMDSVYKKLLRFLKKVELCPVEAARLICRIRHIDLTKKHIVAIDRTYWQYGKIHLNFLYLSIIVAGYAIPILFLLCGPNKKGHSSFEERQKLFDYLNRILPFEQIECVVADREFMGGDWMRYLAHKKIKFVQRCKDKKLYMSNQRGEMVLAKNLYAHLKVGQTMDLGLRRISQSNPFWAFVTVLRLEDGETLVLACSEGIEDPLQAYRARWKIELCFRSLKSYGFHMEDLSITEPKRVTNLLLIVNIAFAIALEFGTEISRFVPVTVKKHGRKSICLVTLGLRFIVHAFQQIRMKFFSLTTMLNLVKNRLRKDNK